MSNTPTDDQAWQVLLEIPEQENEQAVVGVFARAVLAKWGTPQPVVRGPLTDEQLAEMMRDTWGCASIAPRHAETFARAIEAEVRKQDEALIRQMLEALNTCDESDGYTGLRQFFDEKAVESAITAARARLGEKT